LKYPPVARTRPTAQIVPEFSGKDRFFAVFAPNHGQNNGMKHDTS
jgi:hypothetical protein